MSKAEKKSQGCFNDEEKKAHFDEDKKKQYFEMGYQQACLDNNVPYVRVRKGMHDKKMIILQTALTADLFDVCKADWKAVVADKVVNELEKAKI